MRCAFDPEGARLTVARLTGVYLFRVRRQQIADEKPRCPADRVGVTRGGRTRGCGGGTELAESCLKILDIPAAMNWGAGGCPVSSRDSPRNQEMSAQRAEMARLGTHARSIPFCVPQQKKVAASYAARSGGSARALAQEHPPPRRSPRRCGHFAAEQVPAS